MYAGRTNENSIRTGEEKLTTRTIKIFYKEVKTYQTCNSEEGTVRGKKVKRLTWEFIRVTERTVPKTAKRGGRCASRLAGERFSGNRHKGNSKSAEGGELLSQKKRGERHLAEKGGEKTLVGGTDTWFTKRTLSRKNSSDYERESSCTVKEGV